MKPGRNDPCPCGSGRKYKHCCLRTAGMTAPETLTWRRVRRAIDGLVMPLLNESQRHFGNSAIDEAWAEFNLFDDDKPFDPQTPHMPVFMSWFLYDWLPDPHDTATPAGAHTTTTASAYLARAGKRLDAVARRYIQACTEMPFSFHEVLDCQPGHGFRLRDVLLGTEADVLEQSGSADARTGGLLFGKVAAIEGVALLDACSPVMIPPVNKPSLIELRRRIVTIDGKQSVQSGRDFVDAVQLREWGFEIRELYLEIVDRLMHPQLPKIENADGDPLELTTLIFDLDAPEAAAHALKSLDAGGSPRERPIQRDAEGRFVRADITWQTPHNALLGSIVIEGKRLRAEVNSARRAATLRKTIEDLLGETAHARPSVVQSVQSVLSRTPTPREAAQRKQRDAEQAEFAARPEVHAAMREHMLRYYRQWIDETIPVLGNRTPRAAVGDADGREAVEALVMQIERDGVHMSPPLDPGVVRELRATLGLVAPD